MSAIDIADLQNRLKAAGNPWTARANKITALDTNARARLLGLKVDRAAIAALSMRPRMATAVGALPGAVDWRNVGGRSHISPVKDQGGCGSCVSFCVCATTESMVSIATGALVDLSEADLHFCSAHGASCGGWWPPDAIDEGVRRGIPTEELFPYQSAFGPAGAPQCRINDNRDQHLYKPSGHTALVSTAERKQWLATRGPLCAGFHVYDDFFAAGDRVYRHVSGNHAGYHCVEIVGYSDTDKCWIAKNSWGDDWGDQGFFRIGYGECGIDDTSNDRDPDGTLNRFPMFGIEGVQVPGGWRGFQLAPANSVAQHGPVTAVSRVPNSMEAWWVAPNGSVQDAYWYEGGQWQRFELAPPGSASVNGGIAGVSRIPGSMEVWWIGANGSVQGAYWYEGGSWARYELAPAGSASVTAGIAAVSRVPGSMEVWWVAPDGSVQDAYWYEGGQWQHFQLAGAGSASASGGINAVSRIPGSMEVWWVGANGSIQDAYWYEGGQWQRFELAPAGSASRNGRIAALSRIPGSMEVWWVGANGSVQDAYWYDGGQWQRFELAPAGSASLNGGVSAVSRIAASMEVWWVGANGSVQDAYWYDGANWQRFELAPAGSAASGGGMASVSRVPNSMELWWVGTNGTLQDNFWYP